MIVVVVDRSKMEHFIAMASPITGDSAGQAYYENVSSYMEYHNQFSVIGIPYSLVHFGRSYFGYKGPSPVSLHPTIHKRTRKWRYLIAPLKCTCDVLQEIT